MAFLFPASDSRGADSSGLLAELREDTEVSDSLRWKIFHSKCKKNNNIADIFIFTPLILFQIYGGLQGLFNFFLAFLHGGR